MVPQPHGTVQSRHHALAHNGRVTGSALYANRRWDRIFLLLLLIPLAWLLWLFSGPRVPALQALGTTAVLAVFGLFWLGLATSAWRDKRPLTWYAVAAGATVIVLVLIVLQLPRQARWAASRPAFDRAAAKVAANPDKSVFGRVGWYDVNEFSQIEGGWIVHHKASSGLFDDAGFAYLPAGPP